jgi:hypothetical protein
VGAKASLVVIAVLAAAGCAGGLERFAPPGFVKYEDRAKGLPVSPAIADRIEAQSGTDAGFPNLSEQPIAAPAGIAAPERVALGNELDAARDALLQAVEADKAAAAAERADSIEPARDALDEALLNDNAAARAERAPPPAPPPIKE